MSISEFMVLNTLSEYVISSTSGRDVISQEWSAKVVKDMENTNQINDSNPILLWLWLCPGKFSQARVDLNKIFLTVLGSASFFQFLSCSGGSCSQKSSVFLFDLQSCSFLRWNTNSPNPIVSYISKIESLELIMQNRLFVYGWINLTCSWKLHAGLWSHAGTNSGVIPL